ncbi:carboxymuconolactone decarboxylase family protein [Natrinema salaciae]|uniref:Carboxymuconolactone decarboxylase family protein n=1 Tax=Natrinema salaciae TaxID=1186196 RepID=A0A1H9BXZ5_9EURY|nr:carboxymuconolactone decarboxylase family protein [Natrinema salaciae]SEP93855.1 Carboxymuconolactone decarboxylase family protein [Natrinema salaciae]
MARVPLLEPADLPEEYRYLFTENDVGDAHIFRAMANAPELLQWYLRYSTRLWDVLPEREREIVILATARALEHEYEWHQHVRLGREAGVTDAEIIAISDGTLEALDDRDAALTAYARAVALGDPRDGDHDRLGDHYDAETVVGVAMLVGHYVATARALDAFDVATEEPFVGWRP